MTVKEWAQQQSGIVLKVPKGTRSGVIIHEYKLSTGEWVQDPRKQGEAWDQCERRMRYQETDRDQYVELHITAFEGMALKALSNKSGRSVDGPLTVKRRR